MQIVIDIPEDDYKFIKDIQDYISGRRSGRQIEYNIINAILNGTPLPKGHGRLIDADALKECEQKWSCDYEPDGYSHVVEIRDIDDEPTIIEADKEQEE